VTVTGDHDCVRSKGPFVVHSAVRVPENDTGMGTEIPKLDRPPSRFRVTAAFAPARSVGPASGVGTSADAR
jgi:hypothetical protein